MNDSHFTSRMLMYAGVLMAVSGILTAICIRIAYGGILFAAASCMFFAARNFRIAEDKKGKEAEQSENDT